MLSRRLLSKKSLQLWTCQSGCSPVATTLTILASLRAPLRKEFCKPKNTKPETEHVRHRRGAQIEPPDTHGNHSFPRPQPSPTSSSSRSPTTPRDAHKLHHIFSSRETYTNPKEKHTKKSQKHTQKSTRSHPLPPRNSVTQPRKIAETRSKYHSPTTRILLEAGPKPLQTSPILLPLNIQEDSISREYATHSHSTRQIPRDCQLSI